jgi:beta-lactamase regulating signal transducer with metallopeptidase domain
LIAALIIKPTLVLGAAAGVTALMSRCSAAARHAVWAGGVLATLALPLLSVTLPTIDVPAPFTIVHQSTSTPRHLTPDTYPQQRTIHTPPLDRDELATRLPTLLLALWIAGALLVGGRRAVAELRLRRIVRRAQPFRGGTLGRVVLSDEVSSPAVAGVLRPVVLLPVTADTWTESDLRTVLVHEMAHIARGDCALNLAGDIARIVYWCNPLMHSAVRRMRAESERACDDRVLLSGAEPVAYAHTLLTMATDARLPTAATAMARPRELESRLLAVLDRGVRRAALPGAARLALGALGICLALPAAAITLRAAPLVATVFTTPEPDQRGDSLASPLSERLPLAPDAYRVSPAATAALRGPDSALVHLLVTALDHHPENDADLVRERAAWALSQLRAGRLIEPLLDALAAQDWRVQSYAAWALAITHDSRAVAPLIPLLQHPVWRLRAMAAYALSAARDPSALVPMNAALTDPAWQVRLEAVEYFAALGGPSLAVRVRPLATDRHVAVRLAAQRALGAQ